jgi:pimeloyl-ACP methyl ester carboxylesterase
MKILFLHGYGARPGGLKPAYLQQQGHEVINPALGDEDFAASLRIAQQAFNDNHPEVVVGSSRGGAVAMNIETGDTPLVLLCPAWRRWGTAQRVKPQTLILHAREDETIPFADSVALAANSGLTDSALLVVGQDHRLADDEALAALHDAVRQVVAMFPRTS